MLRGIVGLRLPMTRLEGKRKMSQNRSMGDRAGDRRKVGGQAATAIGGCGSLAEAVEKRVVGGGRRAVFFGHDGRDAVDRLARAA